MLLDDKVAVITGAASGVGRASALRFAAEGARLVCADLDVDGAKETARLVEEAGGIAAPVGCDVAVEDDVAAALGAAVDRYGRLDVVFNNVGIPTPRLGAALEDHTAADFERLFAVNVGGAFYGCKHAVLRFKEQGSGGAIVNTGSVAGLVGWGGTVYGASKGAVHALTRSVAIEVAPLRIRVNAICPAAMPRTGFMAAGGLQVAGADLDQIADHVAATHPLGRHVTPEDCAEAALFLASDRAGNITGVLLPVDAGYVAR
jgi:NAD(P)-dependent dehydrogenase (short-subunit alcohol dehydrogenase family)